MPIGVGSVGSVGLSIVASRRRRRRRRETDDDREGELLRLLLP